MKKRVELADLKVGDEVEITESYPDALFTFRGKVTETEDGAVSIGGESYFRTVLAKVECCNVLQVDVEQPDPPAVRAAVVKYYDPSYLCTKVAFHSGDSGWYDLDSGGPVELDGKDWTVLFDPRKDS